MWIFSGFAAILAYFPPNISLFIKDRSIAYFCVSMRAG